MEDEGPELECAELVGQSRGSPVLPLTGVSIRSLALKWDLPQWLSGCL